MRIVVNILFLLPLLFFFLACKTETESVIPETFSSYLGTTFYDNGFEYYDFIIEEDNTIVVA